MCSGSWPIKRGDRTVVRLADRESGLSARTIARCLPSGLYRYLVARGGTPVRANPVPPGLSARREEESRGQDGGYSYAAAVCGAAS
jgi:hypothetical protein